MTRTAIRENRGYVKKNIGASKFYHNVLGDDLYQHRRNETRSVSPPSTFFVYSKR
jgi:hypothetical protein